MASHLADLLAGVLFAIQGEAVFLDGSGRPEHVRVAERDTFAVLLSQLPLSPAVVPPKLCEVACRLAHFMVAELYIRCVVECEL
jgi:hypothetical protein